MFRAMKTIPILVAAALAAMLATPPAEAAVGDWTGDGGKARVRLVASGVDSSGRLMAGLEIELAPGWNTYWRTPGDAGIPPVLDFTASQNVGKVDVGFPPPTRHDDGYSVTNIYEGTVVLPLSVAVPDPKAAADLALTLDIGVCSDVCVPDHFELSLNIPDGAADPDAEAILDPARKAVPGKPEPGVFAVDSIRRDGGTAKHAGFAITATVPDAPNAQVFVEGAPDWYPDVPKYEPGAGGKAVYRFAFDTLGSKTPLEGGKVRVTIESGGRAMEHWVALP
jgi:DsbC/DsbD-like thiol-disulfide interchange protein